MARERTPCVLILAGLDPSGGAGLLADAEAVRELGAIPLCVPTALTVQSRARARSFAPVSTDYLNSAARALLEEEPIAAIKLGMLASPEIARALAALLAEPRAAQLPLVLDPVLASSSGAPLFLGSAAEARAAVSALWGRAIVTPNGPEAQALLDLPAPPRTPQALEAAARALLAAGAGAVLIKGGHAEGDEALDLLVERGDRVERGARGDDWHTNQNALSTNPLSVRVSRLAGPRLRAGTAPLEARGTGCRLASALAAGLALGRAPLEAARDAKALVARYLLRAAGWRRVARARDNGHGSAMPRVDPDPFQAALLELLRDADVGHLAHAAAAELLAAEHRMSWRFTQRALHGDADAEEGRAPEERPFESWEQTAPVYLSCIAALERFGKDRKEGALIEVLEGAAEIFAQACS